MKHLIYASPALTAPHFGILLEEAESLYREGHEVTFAYCNGLSHYCILNPHGDRLLCAGCRKCAAKWIKQYLSAGIKVLPLSRKKIDTQKQWQYQCVKDIKAIIYKDVYIGYGVMSSYTTVTRDPDPDFNSPAIRKYFDFCLAHAAMLTDTFTDIVEKIKPDSISIFTGRLIDNRPLFDIGKARNIELRVNECLGGLRADSPIERIIYHNNLPHSIPYNTSLLEKIWSMDNEPVAEKERKGKDFYERRRNGVPAGDRVYTDKQQKGLLPAQWDTAKRNIVIFNSSEDEFSAVGKEFDQYSLFESQYEGIKYILENCRSDDYHFYLRVHPNLSLIKFKYHTDLYKLPEKYSNLTVIPATDPCSTYDLLDAAEKVIVFGSTMGAEAAYWQKPVILLGGAFYYMLDICYTPDKKEDVLDLIQHQLLPKDSYNAIKYGYYLLNRYLLTIPARFVDYSARKVKLLGYEFQTSAYLKILGSITIGKIFQLALLVIAMKRKRIKFPNKLYYECKKAGK